MLSGIHFLLTYKCNTECDHCFLYSTPFAKGTFTLAQVKAVIDELANIDSVTSVCFEGGEPFLFYPVLVESIKYAQSMGYKTGIVTNCYWATCQEDAVLWLDPLIKSGIGSITVSDDTLHYKDGGVTPSKYAQAAAKDLGLDAGAICTERPAMTKDKEGNPVIGGGVMFRGRAADNLTEGLPTKPWDSFAECPPEDLRDPGRVHVDPFGHVHLCQGVVMGNLWKTPLSQLVAGYDPDKHPIIGPLLRGGPAALIKEYDLPHEEGYIDACHACYLARKALLDKFPEYLAPRQVYGKE